MQLHNLKPKHPPKGKKPRVGRGGKRGTTSGRGTKGQRSRAGHRIRPAIRDLIQRLPKLRGTKNIGVSQKPAIVRIEDLNKLTDAEITLKSLKTAKLIKRKAKAAKILAGGKLERKVSIKGLAVSAGAKKQIESAGGVIANVANRAKSSEYKKDIKTS